jgi:hypothetical protein
MGRRTLDPAVRFRAKVDVRGPDDCWPWLGALNSDGYGVFRISRDDGLVLAHRYAMALDGRDPGALCGRHSCDTPACVNPAHLDPGTKAQNSEDARARGRTNRGERNGGAKLTAADAVAIRARADAGENQSAIAADYGIGQPNVSDIYRRRRWAHAEAA